MRRRREAFLDGHKTQEQQGASPRCCRGRAAGGGCMRRLTPRRPAQAGATARSSAARAPRPPRPPGRARARPHGPARAQVRGRSAGSGFRITAEALPDAAKLDLGRYSEETRSALYLLAVTEYWTRRGEADEYEIPDFTPDQAELTVHFFCRRWFVSWRDLGQPRSAPVEDREPLLQIEINPGRPLGVSFNPL
jgi:hypothetical protein